MRHLLITLLAVLTCLACRAADEDEVDVFAQYECKGDNVVQGDSIVVNVVIYSSQPFQRAACTTKNAKIKGGHSRLMERNFERQQQRVRLNRGVYYAILWDSYVVGSSAVENIKFPELQFDLELEVSDGEAYIDPFDPFGFFGRPKRRSHVVKRRVKTSPFTLPVIEKPKRSTQEAIKSGSRIA